MIFSAPGMVVGLTLASIAFHCEFTSSPFPYFHNDLCYSQT